MVILRIEDPPDFLIDLVDLDPRTLRDYRSICHLNDCFLRNSKGSLSLKHN